MMGLTISLERNELFVRCSLTSKGIVHTLLRINKFNVDKSKDEPYTYVLDEKKYHSSETDFSLVNTQKYVTLVRVLLSRCAYAHMFSFRFYPWLSSSLILPSYGCEEVFPRYAENITCMLGSVVSNNPCRISRRRSVWVVKEDMSLLPIWVALLSVTALGHKIYEGDIEKGRLFTRKVSRHSADLIEEDPKLFGFCFNRHPPFSGSTYSRRWHFTFPQMPMRTSTDCGRLSVIQLWYSAVIKCFTVENPS